MSTVVEIVKLNPFERAGAVISGEVETVVSEEGTFLVEERAGDGDVEDGVHLFNLFVVRGLTVNANFTGQPA